ncbi:hypothetical protein BBH99_07590 [Chryseobacterium contaminans]|uniref:YD repeat-containing protein n=1 Tax=Chryseobacterium contaminans TaxID=1423959 RepID=A0A1M6YAA4_9FLAO|nr:hypothetical protein [Chryseobacterium contaminans]OCA78725.1 hypothetical protein BBH99_07590 [Chryseobacterium contaminans]SHL15226.1 hypothetical protein SAMN05444407_102429 [Chryseobacterium contaminans]
MKKIIFLAISFSLLSSCSSSSDEVTSKPESPKPEVPVKSKKIIEVKQDNKLVYTFTYNSDGKISEIGNYSNTGSLFSTTKVEYTNGFETRRSTYNLQNQLYNYHTYIYTGKHISERAIYSREPSTGKELLVQRTYYTNDPSKSDHNLTGVQYYDGSGALVAKSDITYIDSNGSSSTFVYNAAGKKTNSTLWMRDNAIAWDKVLDPFTYQHEHNTTSVTDNNLIDGTTTGYNIEYTYDSSNYPLTAKYSFSNGVKYTYTFTWQ